MKNIYKVKGNYYITNNEVGKKGDWVISFIDDESFENFLKLEESHFNCGFDLEEDFKKIILTTHELLIKDGVQSIDKPFLIWLINNPNCEEFEIINEQYTQNYHKDIWYNRHKIIIPSEEPKQGIDIQEFEKKANEIIANVKRMYSEEEVLGFLQEMNDLETRLEGMIYIKKWFEQLKNKQRWN